MTSTLDPDLDGERLGRQLATVLDVMRDGGWRTLAELCTTSGYGSTASVSARLRDLRARGWCVDRRRRPGCKVRGVWEYRVTPPPPSAQTAFTFAASEGR